MSRRNVLIISTILILLIVSYNFSYRIYITNLIMPDDITLTLRQYGDSLVTLEIKDKETLLKKMKSGIVLPLVGHRGYSRGRYALKIELERDGEWLGQISTAYELVSIVEYNKTKNIGIYFNYDLHTYIQELYVEALNSRGF